MIVAGTIIEVGQLDDEAGAMGFALQRPSGAFITIKGLTDNETRAVAQMLFERTELILQRAPGDPATVGAPP